MGKLNVFIGETVVYGFANVFSRVFAMLLIPFYAKFLGKTDYSNLIMLQSIFSVLTFLLALNSGVFFFYYKFYKKELKKRVYTTWFYYGIFTTAIILILLSLFSQNFIQFFVVTESNSSVLAYCVILIGFQLFPYVFTNTTINYYRVIREPKKAIGLVFVEALFTSIFVTSSLYIFNWGLVGVMLSQILSRSLSALIYHKRAAYFLSIKYFSFRILKKIFAYTWPFFIISVFGWAILSIDKFIGAKQLIDTSDIALLSLAMQLVIPITILADMVRMAIGPFVMSIHKENDAQETYQKVFDLSIFSSAIMVVLISTATPYLTLMLTDKSFLGVIYLVPLMALSNIFSMASNQFSISFGLKMKNIYILYASVIAGIIGILINYLLMAKFGFVVSAYSQVLSYVAMASFLYFFGTRKVNLKIQLKSGLIYISILLLYIWVISLENNNVLQGNFYGITIYGIIFVGIIMFAYVKTQQINIIALVKNIKTKLKR
jgi:O-antigen/teichoic acid export membrane protein